MSKTLFWYIIKDLLRIFFMASGALAGIMSFGGLLRPLTEHGLDAYQVGRMLSYFTPAMTTYSFPVAALFATTMVYGRLSADNELCACRSSGISYLSMTAPAMVLGLVVAIVSIMFLCFVVPVYTLKVEQVVYSNLAQLVQNAIERTHQIELDQLNVYAQSAAVKPADPNYPLAQRVELTGPMIVSYAAGVDSTGRHVGFPTEFWMAQYANAYIWQTGDDVYLEAVLINSSKFSRQVQNAPHAFVGRAQFGPIPFPSPIKEDAKFMDIHRLKELYQYPEKSRRLADLVKELNREDQERKYLETVADALASPEASFVFQNDTETMTIYRGDASVQLSDRVLIISSLTAGHQIRVVRRLRQGNQTESEDSAVEMRLSVEPRLADQATDELPATPAMAVVPGEEPRNTRMEINVDGYDVLVQAGEDEAAHKKFRALPFMVPMPDKLVPCEGHTAAYYDNLGGRDAVNRDIQLRLKVQRAKLTNKLQSEIHSRASFSISCLVLVMVGCALGMMFQSGNLLGAFTVSFIPAMLTICLVVTGQQLCSNIELPVTFGLCCIWSGNVMVLILAIVLLTRLQLK